MALRVAIVADDLTGALDAAAPFAARGLHTLVAATPDALKPALAETPEVLAVNTVSRHAAPKAAAARVRDALQLLLSHTPEILFKKMDSTLRGPVGDEVAAAASASGRRALICPAVPAQGRCVRHGRLLVNGRPLRETTAGRDARSAVPEDDIARLLEATMGATTGVDAHGPWPRTDHLVADADTAEALSSLARHMLSEARCWLPVGASGLAEALAETAFGTPQFTLAPNPEPPAVFVVGSRTETTRAQVRALQRQSAVMHLRAPGGRLECGVPPGPAPTLLTVPDGEEAGDAESVATCLAESAARLIRQKAPGLLVVTGGDTALALLSVLSAPVVTVLGEFEAGVVRSCIPVNGRTVSLVTKAGGFGGSELFVRLASWTDWAQADAK